MWFSFVNELCSNICTCLVCTCQGADNGSDNDEGDLLTLKKRHLPAADPASSVRECTCLVKENQCAYLLYTW